MAQLQPHAKDHGHAAALYTELASGPGAVQGPAGPRQPPANTPTGTQLHINSVHRDVFAHCYGTRCISYPPPCITAGGRRERLHYATQCFAHCTGSNRTPMTVLPASH